MKPHVTRRASVLALGTILTASALLSPATIAAADTELITATPQIQTVIMPAPGSSEPLRSTVTNTHDTPVIVKAQLLSDQDDPILSADGPLSISFSVDGESQGETLPLADAVKSPVFVEEVAPGASTLIEATVTMDRSAGNEWAGRSTAAVLSYTAQADESTAEKKPSDQSLALTGAVGIGIAIIVALIVIAMGIALLGRSRRPATTAGPVSHDETFEEESR